ncbi:MAG: N-(5'-phosphoribosyl)anthranilate isomerase [Phototrophicales bacterium]|nr:MAG: N-(5'-phosphoribosyl)anthranilate isomerase [Phototrophicales bacterium]RMG71724.1 MAG: phosphoribosylanthranilate isomerase [Chloroflexota bacterium]
MTIVKICGITTLQDARFAAEAGADMLGFNFYKNSPRYIDVETAQTLCDTLRQELGAACPVLVGIFVNESVSNISRITNKVGLNAAQLSGDESKDMLRELRGIAYKAIQPLDKTMALEDVTYYAEHFPTRVKLPSLLLDAYHPSLRGGTGDQVSVEIALAVKEVVPRLMLAGGLTPENVTERVQAVQPWGVDVASGVEPEGKPGVKDHAKVQAFIQAAKHL